MRDFRDAKAMAQTLREALKAKSVSLTHSESLELIARTFGFPDWNFLAARIQASQPAPAVLASAVPTATVVPVLAIRDLVFFPKMVAPVFVAREKTRRAIERALATDRRIIVVAQRRSTDDDPALDALYPVGVSAGIVSCVTIVDGTLKLMLSGLARMSVLRPVEENFLAAEVAPIEETRGQTVEAAALARAVLDAYQVYANVDYSNLPWTLPSRLLLPSIGDPGELADTVASLLSAGIDQRQQLLETGDVVTRLEKILELMKAGQQAA
ncbi:MULTISPECIES: LON peptidase substrate-binding domain-containing protein [Bradyrhizobium]|uniref:ATP-dependent Lon protease n=2 Tax=Bradyrhizobium TaxID=374 RepID=A0ABY0PGJ3_9BRAD|nr:MULTISPECIES: LON peptidase substrate-binding domain-containing protein [Bradyrhizobium]SDI33310.1 ATP-dependent Lon protease [Bradyrhizobium ottawaense]SED63215.1 ATP-dependent Lon protease [Bradyrhizobium lablabi]